MEQQPTPLTPPPQQVTPTPIEQQYSQVNPPKSVSHERVFFEKIEQIIIFFYFFLAALLSFRFVLALFGANRRTPFVNFIYQLTLPFMFPFEGMFGQTNQAGNFRFETEVLVALVVYGLALFGLSKLVRIIFR